MEKQHSNVLDSQWRPHESQKGAQTNDGPTTYDNNKILTEQKRSLSNEEYIKGKVHKVPILQMVLVHQG